MLNYRLVKKDAFLVSGKKIVTTHENNLAQTEIPKFWDAFNQSEDSKTLCSMTMDERTLGICYDIKKDGSFSYMIGIKTKTELQGFESMLIPASTWAVFESIGPMPHSIQNIWQKIFNDFLVNSPYMHAPMADFESYSKGDVNAADYYAEVWIPILKK